MPRLHCHVLWALLLPLVGSVAASAQDRFDQGLEAFVPPPFVVRADPGAQVIRDARAEPLIVQAPVLPGDRILTTSGRLAVQWPDGVILAVDAQSAFDLLGSREVSLWQGSAIVIAPTGMDSLPYRVAAAGAVVTIAKPGRYAIRADALEDPAAGATAREGQVLDGSWAAFVLWTAETARDVTAPGAETAYLPQDLRVYAATLAQAGEWAYETDAGYVWYPRVEAGWQPYSSGTWVNAGAYGWSWAGVPSWTWPTHHYGRWGMGTRGRWCWQPGSAWSPRGTSTTAGVAAATRSTGTTAVRTGAARDRWPTRGPSTRLAPRPAPGQASVTVPQVYVPSTYARPTPFLNPQWRSLPTRWGSSAPGLTSMGLPQPAHTFTPMQMRSTPSSSDGRAEPDTAPTARSPGHRSQVRPSRSLPSERSSGSAQRR